MPDSPAMAVYERISELRDRHADVIWGGRDASPADLLAILADLQAGLAELATPLNRELGDGNRYLRFRRVNFLIDKIIVLDRLEDHAAAIRAWEELSGIVWLDLSSNGPEEIRKRLRRLLDRPEAAAVRAQLAVSARWGRGPAPTSAGNDSLATPYSDPLPLEQRIAGLSAIWAAARDGFVWFDHVPELDWDRAYLDAIPRVIAMRDTPSYYRELMRFVALLRDAHCNVYPPKELQRDFYSRPGIRTGKVEGRVIVLEVFDPELSTRGLHVGDEVVSIDGIDVEEYARERVAPYQSSSTQQDRDKRTYSCALLSGAAAQPVLLGIRDAQGRQTMLSAPRSGYTMTSPEPREAFSIRADAIAVITSTQFENNAAADLLGAHIQEVLKAKGLILDLRDNSGGSSHCGLNLLSWLSGSPLPSMICAYRENDVMDRARMRGSAPMVFRTLDSEEYHVKHDAIFNGPVAMLIDARTFSAAEDTAAVFRLMGRGVIVGAASGGGTGQPWLFDLPGGGSARICVKRDSYPDGTTFVGTGIIPDIEVPVTIADVRNGNDAALERAAQALLTR